MTGFPPVRSFDVILRQADVFPDYEHAEPAHADKPDREDGAKKIGHFGVVQNDASLSQRLAEL